MLKQINPLSNCNHIVYLVIFAALLVYFQIGIAEPDSSRVSHSLTNGATALQFEITDNFQLSNFQGATFSGKKHLSGTSALRLGLNLNGFKADEKSPAGYTNDSLNEILYTDRDDNRYRIELVGQYIRYFDSDHEIKVYWGAGPLVGFYNSKTKSSTPVINDPEEKYISEAKITSWYLGGSGIIGAEYFITSQISLIAEYGMILEYESAERTQSTKAPGDNDKSLTTERSSISLYPSNVKFGVSLYF